jgi:hypothetical protein
MFTNAHSHSRIREGLPTILPELTGRFSEHRFGLLLSQPELEAPGSCPFPFFKGTALSLRALRRPSVRICYSDCSADLRICIFISELKCTESLSS